MHLTAFSCYFCPAVSYIPLSWHGTPVIMDGSDKSNEYTGAKLFPI